MLIKFIFNWSIRNLFRNRQRSFLTALGIAAAVGCVFLMQGFANYSYRGLTERFAKSGNGYLQIGRDLAFNSAAPEKFRIERAQLEIIRSEIQNDRLLNQNIDSISLKRKFSGLIGTANGSEVFQGQAVEPKDYSAMSSSQKFTVPSGLKSLGEFDVVLGKTLGERLNVNIGEVVSILVSTDGGRTNAMDFTVAGFVETGSSQLDSVFLLTSISSTLKLLDTNEVDVLMIGLNDTEKTRGVAKRIQEAVLSRHQKQDLGVRTWDQLADYYQSVRALYERILGVIKIILGVIAILAVSNSMLLITHERRGEIAMLKAIGMYDSKIMTVFTIEGVILSVFGGVMGILGTIVIASLISAMGGIPMPPPPGSSEGYFLKFSLVATDAIRISLFFTICTAIASFLAVKKSVKLHIPSALAASVLLLLINGLTQITFLSPVYANTSGSTKVSAKEMLNRWENLRGVTDSNIVLETKFENLSANNEVTDAVTYRVAASDEFVLAVSISDRPGDRMAILSTNDGLWMQKEGMRKPMRISPAQRLLGQASNGDIVNVKLNKDYVADRFEKNVLVLIPQEKSQSAGYSRIEVVWSKDLELPTEAKFFAVSGKLLKTASYFFESNGDRKTLKSAIIKDAINSSMKTRVIFGSIAKSEFSSNFFNPELVLSSMKQLVARK